MAKDQFKEEIIEPDFDRYGKKVESFFLDFFGYGKIENKEYNKQVIEMASKFSNIFKEGVKELFEDAKESRYFRTYEDEQNNGSQNNANNSK